MQIKCFIQGEYINVYIYLVFSTVFFPAVLMLANSESNPTTHTSVPEKPPKNPAKPTNPPKIQNLKKD